MDLVRRNKQPAATDPWAVAVAAQAAVSTPTWHARTPRAAPAAAQGASRRVGLGRFLAGHTLKFLWHLASAALILDSPRRASSTDPGENAKMRHASAILWAIVIPALTLLNAGFLAAAVVGLVGWFLLVRNRAATQSITVSLASLVDDLIIIIRRSREARTAAVMTAALIVVGILTSIFALAIGQVLLVTAWLGALGLARAATTAGIEDLEQIDLSTPVSRVVLAVGEATNRAVSKLRGKAGTDVVAR